MCLLILWALVPLFAINDVLFKARLTVDDIDVFEINEAFASQVVFCMRFLGLPEQKVNPCGGAIALGHPLGCSGNRFRWSPVRIIYNWQISGMDVLVFVSVDTRYGSCSNY